MDDRRGGGVRCSLCPSGSGQRVALHKRHQALDARFVSIPSNRPDVTQVGQLFEFFHDPFIRDRFIACHSFCNRLIQLTSMQDGFLALDKGIRNALGDGQHTHPVQFIEPDLIHGVAFVDHCIFRFLDLRQGDLCFFGFIQSSGQAISPDLDEKGIAVGLCNDFCNDTGGKGDARFL